MGLYQSEPLRDGLPETQRLEALAEDLRATVERHGFPDYAMAVVLDSPPAAYHLASLRGDRGMLKLLDAVARRMLETPEDELDPAERGL